MTRYCQISADEKLQNGGLLGTILLIMIRKESLTNPNILNNI